MPEHAPLITSHQQSCGRGLMPQCLTAGPVKAEGQKYHLEDEGHRPTDADRLVEAQLQILTRKEEVVRPRSNLH